MTLNFRGSVTYDESAVDFHRHCVCHGTTNPAVDRTGWDRTASNNPDTLTKALPLNLSPA
jgi:hypothetical protein